MQPHKIKRKAVSNRNPEYESDAVTQRVARPYPASPSKGPLDSDSNAVNIDSGPPFPVLTRGGAVPQHSLAHQTQGPAGPRAQKHLTAHADDSGGPQQSIRSDTDRQVAFPPSTGPRAPIRNAATTGLTSVHIGVKPRVVGQDTADTATVRIEKDDLVPDMDGYERVPAVPGRVYRSQTEAEEIPGVGVGYGKKAPKAISEDQDDGATAFTASSVSSDSARNGLGQNHYRPQPSQPTVSITEQAAKYDAEYRARLKRSERGSDRRANESLEDAAYWQESIVNDDPRIEGIYTFDYSPNPPGKKKSRLKEETPKSRITEYEDPSRPGVVMKSRSYLPPPVDERSYGVPAGRRVRAFIREKERLEGRSGEVAPASVREQSRKDRQSVLKTLSISSEENPNARAMSFDQTRRVAQADRGSTTPKASKVALVETRPIPTSSRSNPDLKHRVAGNNRQQKTLEQEYEEDEERFRQKVRRMRSEPGFATETTPFDQHARYDLERQQKQQDDHSRHDAWESTDEGRIPRMPEGEEYDEDTERERQEAWRQYYAAMQMYSFAPMGSPGNALPYSGPAVTQISGMPASWTPPVDTHSDYAYGNTGPFMPRQDTSGSIESKPQVPRKSRHHDRKEDPSRTKVKQKKNANTGLALTGMGIPSNEILPTPMYPQHHPESYFGYDPYATEVHTLQAKSVPYPSTYTPTGYNSTSDPFAMHSMGANLPNMQGMSMGIPPMMRSKKSWYAGM